MYTILTGKTEGGFTGYVRDINEKIVDETAEYYGREDAYKAAKELREIIKNNC